jgi:hypothetical protein
MVQWPDLPKEAMDDPFCPPAEPVQVECIHCGMRYTSDQIVWIKSGDQGFWRCPVEGCDGAGFGFDIFPVDDPIISGRDEDNDFGLTDDEESELDEDDDLQDDDDDDEGSDLGGGDGGLTDDDGGDDLPGRPRDGADDGRDVPF